MRIVAFTTHPIQYQIPWFQKLSRISNVELRVYFALLPGAEEQGQGFGIPFSWDIPLLDGYSWELLPRTNQIPSFTHFRGTRVSGLKAALRTYKPDAALILGWHSAFMLQALVACIQLGIPRIVRGESNNLQPRPKWKQLIHRVLLSEFNAFLAVGKANRDFYLGNGVKERRIFSAPYFVDNERLQRQLTQAPPRNELRHRWGFSNKDCCFLYVGKLEPKKRVMDFLTSLQLARQRNPNVRGLVVGSGALKAQAEDYVLHQGLPVTFAGFLNQTKITEAYAAADCLVLPSDFGETWGLVVNEAMACGLPAIVSDRVGSGPDLIEDGVTGYVIRFADTGVLAERMLSVAANSNERTTMGKNARARIECYSVDQAVLGTVQALAYVTQTSG